MHRPCPSSVCAHRCSRPHLHNDVCSASVFWLLPCDVSTVNGPVPSGEGVARMADFSKKGGPSLLDFFWSKLSDGRTSLLLHLDGARPPGRLVRVEDRAFEHGLPS